MKNKNHTFFFPHTAFGFYLARSLKYPELSSEVFYTSCYVE